METLKKGRMMKYTTIEALTLRFLAVALACGAFQCIDKPMDPMMPRWNVDLSAPVANRTYTLADIADKDTSILQVVPGGSQLMMKTSVQADPTFVGDRISLDPINTSFLAEVGPFSINSQPLVLQVDVPGFTPGQSTVIPPMSPVDLPVVSGDIPCVQSASLRSGTLSLTIQNRMPAPVKIESPIALVNEAGGAIAQFDFGTALLPAGSERSVSADLAGVVVLHRVRLQGMRVSSPGSGLSVVTIPDSMLIATLTPTNLLADGATVSNVNPQHIQVTRTIPLNTQTLVRDVWVNRGTLNFHFVSTVGLQGTFRMRLPELFQPSGQPYERLVTLAAHDSVDFAVDLAQYRMHDPANGFLRALTAEVTTDVAGSSGIMVTVNAKDYLSAHVGSSAVIADSAVAVLKPTSIAVNQSVALNLGTFSKKFRGSLDIPNANMTFTPHTSMNTPMELNLRLEAKDRAGKIVALQVPLTKGATGLGEINFAAGDVGSFLSQVSGNIPDSLRVTGNVVLNPDYDTTQATSIGRNCAFTGNVDMSVPMTLRIVDGCFADTLVMGDTSGTGKSDARIDEKTLNDVNSGRMHVDIDNGLPMAVKVKIVLLDRDHKPLLAVPQTEGDSVAITAGIVANGDVQATTRSSRIIELKGTEVQFFNKADFVQVSLGVATPGVSAVNFRTTDNVHVRVWSEFSYKVNP